jgi:hypothetical protein
MPAARHQSADDLSRHAWLASSQPSSALGNRRAASRGRAINGGGVGFLIVEHRGSAPTKRIDLSARQIYFG